MSQQTSRKTNIHSSKLSTMKQIPLSQMRNQVLAPIYDKVQLLRKQLEQKQPVKQIQKLQSFKNTTKQYFLQMQIDRDIQIQNSRKHYQSQNFALNENMKSSKSINMKTSTNWKEHTRNKTKSLINFLASNKVVRRPFTQQTKQKQNEENTFIEHDAQQQEHFYPLGEEYKKEKLYQQSLKSQTQSLSSFRPESSLKSSKIAGITIPRESSKKYLRKGTRVRQILARQLKTPEQRTSSASSGLTYLKQYDQWVPTTLVEQKKAELQSFMNIIYGQKKAKGEKAVDLDKIELIYL